MPDHRGAVPVTVLTGFLGSGKTTLLNRLLVQPGGRRLAVLVNEFGEVDIDSDLIAEQADGVIGLRNGCVCCTVGDDLDEALRMVVGRTPRPYAVVLETTGIADPLPLVDRLVGGAAPGAALDSVVTVVDALHLATNLRRSAVTEYQIAFADFLILNKLDLVDDWGRAEAEGLLRRINPNAPILPTRHGEVDPDLLLGTGRFDPERHLHAGDGHAGHAHAGHAGRGHLAEDRFVTVAYTSEHSLSLDALERWLDDLPPEVIRGKGVLWVDGLDRRVVVHVVGARKETAADRPWGDERPLNKLVLIGTDLDRAALLGGLRGCEVRG